MAEQLGDLTRTHTCGALRTGDVGKDVVLLGWVHRVRDLGGVLFVTNLVFCVMAAREASDGKRYRYPYSLRLVK